MSKESEKAAGERISATEASRAFSEILDRVEGGRRFLIHRHGRDVCEMRPPHIASRRASECLVLLRGRSAITLDDEFSADLLDVIASEPPEDLPSWDS